MSALDHYERGRVLKHAQMFDQAREEFQHAASDPQYAGNAHVQIALCLLATGRYDEAVVAFRQALEVGTFSSKEKAHILYFLGQTLESLGRYAEALEAYGWTRKEDPGFQDVAQRIKHLLAGGRGLLPRRRPASRSVVGDMLRLGGQLTPQVLSLLGQAWTSFGQYAERLVTPSRGPKTESQFPRRGPPEWTARAHADAMQSTGIQGSEERHTSARSRRSPIAKPLFIKGAEGGRRRRAARPLPWGLSRHESRGRPRGSRVGVLYLLAGCRQPVHHRRRDGALEPSSGIRPGFHQGTSGRAAADHTAVPSTDTARGRRLGPRAQRSALRWSLVAVSWEATARTLLLYRLKLRSR